MSEETQNESTWSGLKKTIIGVASTAILGVGGWFTTKLTGGEEQAAPVQQAAPVINITNSNQQTQSAGGGTKVIERVVEKEKPAAPAPKPKKKEGDEFKEKDPLW